MLLVGFMKTEKAKEIRKQLRREYFTIRAVINSNEQLNKRAILNLGMLLILKQQRRIKSPRRTIR